MSLYMETTKIPVEKTVGEIQALLIAAGATGVAIESGNGEIKSLYFEVAFLDRKVPFKLPCRWEPIFKKLYVRIKRQRSEREEELRQQAKRVAWRQILRWTEAQLALVETDMVKVIEVFLPYIQTNMEGQTFYEKIESTGFKQLAHMGEKP